jgi:hypothetical protein
MCLDTIIKNTYKKIKVSEIFGVLKKTVTKNYLQKTLLSKIIHVSRYCYEKYLQEN